MTTVTKKSICASCGGAKLSIRSSMQGILACGACNGRGYILKDEEVQVQGESTEILNNPSHDTGIEIDLVPVVKKKPGRPKKVDS